MPFKLSDNVAGIHSRALLENLLKSLLEGLMENQIEILMKILIENLMARTIVCVGMRPN